MQKFVRLAALAASCLAVGAQAQMYVEGNYISAKVTQSGLAAKPGVLAAMVGYEVHPNLAVEGVLGFGARTDSVTVSGTLMDYKVKSTYGFYLKPHYPLNDKIDLFARVGYLKNKVEASSATFSDSASEGSMALGVGGSYALDKNLYLTMGANQLYKKDGVKATGLNIGAGYRF